MHQKYAETRKNKMVVDVNDKRKRRKRRTNKKRNLRSYPTHVTQERITYFLQNNTDFDYDIASLCRLLKYKYNSMKYHVKIMLREGSLIEVRKIGKGQTYQLPEWFTDSRKEELRRFVDIQ